MPDLLGPCVGGGGPGALGLDGDVVDALANAEEALLTPVGAPGVSNVPELLTVFGFTPTDNADFMSSRQVASVVTVDAASVVIQGLRNGNRAGDGAALVDFLHHLLLAADWAELVDFENAVLVGHEASLSRIAVPALGHGAAGETIVVAAGAIA